jgi:LysM repeat protein
MRWKKKICIKITARRIVAAILIATSSVNLIIVGAAYEAASTATLTQTSFLPSQNLTATFIVPTATSCNPILPTSIPMETLTLTLTGSPTFTPTPTATPTSTSTNPPTSTQCVPKSYWLTYHVQGGDTLYALALSTGSTVDELRQANCLTSTLIYKGQLLYVPRLPINTPTPTWTYTSRPDLPPVVTIISATVSSRYAYDQKLGLWYTYVGLEGNASDPEDGVLPDSSLIWSTDRTDIHRNQFLGTGGSIETVVYSNNCTGVWHTITLTAIDSKGNAAVASVRIFIGSSLC